MARRNHREVTRGDTAYGTGIGGKVGGDVLDQLVRHDVLVL